MSDKIVMCDGSPVTDDHKEIKDNGQQKGYVALSDEERAKGFVRPVREAYVHVGKEAPKYPLRDLTESEKARYSCVGFVRYEKYPSGSDTIGKFWTQDDLNKVGKGCGVRTVMALPLAETYARDPSFYSGTFCVGCGTHLPVDEFLWEGTEERVGS